MDKVKIKEFFNRLSVDWDKGQICKDDLIRQILDNTEVKEGSDVLDVACGTGVLVPYYKERNVSSIKGIDISDQMIQIAEDKYADEHLSFTCADAEEYSTEQRYDVIMIYDAFPHFVHQKELIEHLSSLLKQNGVLSIAHDRSRKGINEHHSNVDDAIACTLISAEELSDIFSQFLELTHVISNDEMYQVTGRKK